MRRNIRALMIAIALACGVSAQDIVLQAWDRQHPDLAFWRVNVQIPLSRPDAAALFDLHYRGAVMRQVFRGKIVSLTPAINPREIAVEMSDPGDPNEPKAVLRAKLLLDTALPGSMPPGSEIRFRGVVRGFQQNPLQLTFEIDPDYEGKIEGWTGQ